MPMDMNPPYSLVPYSRDQQPFDPTRLGGMGMGIGMGLGMSSMSRFHSPLARRDMGPGGYSSFNRVGPIDQFYARPTHIDLLPTSRYANDLRRSYSRDLPYDLVRGRDHLDPYLALAPSRRYPHQQPFYDDRHSYDRYSRGPGCDSCRLKGLPCPPSSSNQHHYHQQQQQHDCSCTSHPRCCDSANTSTKSDFDFKTKDITIRGKARPVRASYLTEAPKFEADLVKYLEKKKEDVVPDRVVDMLISFINREEYQNSNLFDEVTLNILAGSVGAKSAVEYSLGRLKKMEGEMAMGELTSIVATIMMSSKVDSGLKNWLKKYLQNEERAWRLSGSIPWKNIIESRPEVGTETARLMGHMRESEDEGFRML